jgi:FkbM family methyltransferase
MNNIHDFFIFLQRNGMNILNVYDIGACRGEWSTQMKFGGLKASNFYLFEANREYSPILANTGFPHYINVLSSPGRKTVTFYKKLSTGDSYYKENSEHFNNVESVEVPCKTLEQVMWENNLPVPDLVKMDTQGSELDILMGAESLIGKTHLFYVECPIVRYNIGAPNIQEYLDFFIGREYIPVDLFEIHRGENTLIQVDIMFMLKETKERYLGKNEFVRVK